MSVQLDNIRVMQMQPVLIRARHLSAPATMVSMVTAWLVAIGISAWSTMATAVSMPLVMMNASMLGVSVKMAPKWLTAFVSQLINVTQTSA